MSECSCRHGDGNFDGRAVLEAVGQAVLATTLDGTITLWNPAAEQLFLYEAVDVLGRHVLDLTSSDENRTLTAELLQTVGRGGTWTGEFIATLRDGTRLPILAAATPIRSSTDDVVGMVGVCTDVSDLRAAQQEAQTRAAQQETVVDLARLALQQSDLDGLFDKAVSVLSRRLDAPLCKVLELDDTGAVLRLRAGVGWAPGLVGSATVTTDQRSQAGFTLLQDGPVTVDDVRREYRFQGPALLSDHRVVSGMSTVIRCSNRVFGVLGVHTTTRRRFGRQDVAFLEAVAAVLGGAIARDRAVRSLQHSQRSLEYKTTHHDLTGLLNRSAFVHQLDEQPRDRVILALDIDSLQEVNSVLGHDAGDEVLRTVAQRLAHEVGSTGLLGHMGSDRFLVACPDHTDADANTVAERLLATVRAPVQIAGQPLQLTASVGIAHARPAEPAERTLRDVEVALARAKARGREQVAWHDRTAHGTARQRVLMAAELATAIDEGQLLLEYQPTFDLRSGDTASIEALVRWQHPERGLLPPAEFIPIAEVTGQIHALGFWCLSRALHDISNGLDESLGRVWVNVSLQQIHRHGLAKRIKEALHETGVPPDRLGIELTESALARGFEVVLDELRVLSHMGIRVAIDDFGTGFSSLARLHRIPADLLKIDRSFVATLDTQTGVETFRAIIALGHAVSKQVTAEGVETADQLAKLREIGCDLASGFLLAHPTTLEHLQDACDQGSRIIAGRRDLPPNSHA